jgi:hypothetical protein
MYQTASSAREVILLDHGDFTPRSGESRSGRNTSSTSTNDNDTWTAHVHLFRVLSHGESSLWRCNRLSGRTLTPRQPLAAYKSHDVYKTMLLVKMV